MAWLCQVSTEMVICTYTDQRMEDMLYEKLEKRKKDRMTTYETVGNNMVDAGHEFGPGTSYGKEQFLFLISTSFFPNFSYLWDQEHRKLIV